MIWRVEGNGKGLRITPPGRDIRCNTTSPWGENLHHQGWRKAPGNFSIRHMYSLGMTQHNLQTSKPLAYDPHMANAFHPGHWSKASVFLALISSHFVTVSSWIGLMWQTRHCNHPPLHPYHHHMDTRNTMRRKQQGHGMWSLVVYWWLGRGNR